MNPTKQQIADARKFARKNGVNKLLSIGTDPKTAKSNKDVRGWYTAIQYLAPYKLSGINVCPAASSGCIAACLHTAGNPVYMKNKQKARLARTKLFGEYRNCYEILLFAEIAAFERKCQRYDLKACIRLNGTSDIVWENVSPWIFETFPKIQFYDYTKHAKRFRLDWELPRNYNLTFSKSETNDHHVDEILADNPLAKVAVVFNVARLGTLPTCWQGANVFDGDKTDLRFLDDVDCQIVGLRAKDAARKDNSGFVVSL